MRRWMVIAAMCCCIGSVFAASHNPVPGALQKAADPQQKTPNKQEPASSDQRGTEDRPFVIQIKDAPKAQPQPSEAQNQHSDKSPFVWGMTAEENTAVASYLLVVVGAVTALVLVFQAKLLRGTVMGAREEFRASHPPKIHIKHVINVGQAPWDELPVQVELVFVNVGRTTAFVREIKMTTLVYPAKSRLPGKPKYPEPPIFRGAHPLLSGMAWTTGEIVVRAPLTEHERDAVHGRHIADDEVHRLYCFGYVQYADQLTGDEGLRKTAFCRVWKAEEIGTYVQAGRFVPHDDADYEYQE